MVLVIADRCDGWASEVQNELTSRGVSTTWIAPSAVLSDVVLHWIVGNRSKPEVGYVSLAGEQIPFHELTGILVRATRFGPSGDADMDPQDLAYVQREAQAAWLAFLNAVPCRVVNRPLPGTGSGRSLINHQVRAISTREGLTPLPYFVTASAAEALAQCHRWDYRVLVSKIGGGDAPHVYGNEAECIRGLERSAGWVLCVQHLLPGTLYSMVVVGDQVASARLPIHGCVGASRQPVELDQERTKWNASCVAVAQALELDFAEIRLLVTSDSTAHAVSVRGAPDHEEMYLPMREEVADMLATYLRPI